MSNEIVKKTKTSYLQMSGYQKAVSSEELWRGKQNGG